MRFSITARALGCCAATAWLMQACSPQDDAVWSGYAEGEFIYVSAPVAGRLDTLNVVAGQQVEANAPLFSLDEQPDEAVRTEALARLKVAQAQDQNLGKGRREQEIAVTQAQRAQAQVQADLALLEFNRVRQQAQQGFVSAARQDEARTALDQAQARVAELDADLVVARLPARSDERAASQAGVQAAEQTLRQSQWRVSQKQQQAPLAGQISELFFRVGENVPAGQAVLSLLPLTHLKARFFVPEAHIGAMQLNQAVTLSCDGCKAPVAARITYIATQPEYTPPVIYSNGTRAKLVFMVEARPSPEDARQLKPGQPLQVRAVSGSPAP